MCVEEVLSTSLSATIGSLILDLLISGGLAIALPVLVAFLVVALFDVILIETSETALPDLVALVKSGSSAWLRFDVTVLVLGFVNCEKGMLVGLVGTTLFSSVVGSSVLNNVNSFVAL